MKENTTDVFANAPVPKAVMVNVIPSIISMLMVLVYNLADTFFIGRRYAFRDRRHVADLAQTRRRRP